MHHIPTHGLGTFRLKDDVLKHSLKTGLDVGFRHIDTAQIYENEREIGDILQSLDYRRENLFLTSKIWTSNLSRSKLLDSLKQSLLDLKTDYLDLTLIHWPSPKNEVPLKESLTELMHAKEQGLTKSIGISNFTIDQVKEAVSIVGAENIATNQIEVHPFLQNKKVIEECKKHGIKVTAYMPLAYGEVLKSDVIGEIAKKHNISNADVSLTWLLDQDLCIIPSSTSEKHLRSNFNVEGGILDAEDVENLEALERNYRIANPDFAPKWD